MSIIGLKPKRSNKGRMESIVYGADIILGCGEIFFEKQTIGKTYSEGSGTSDAPIKYRMKIGDGVTKYKDLGYADNIPISISGSGNVVTSIGATETGNKTFYAKWNANSASVTIKKDGSNWTSSNPGINVALFNQF